MSVEKIRDFPQAQSESFEWSSHVVKNGTAPQINIEKYPDFATAYWNGDIRLGDLVRELRGVSLYDIPPDSESYVEYALGGEPETILFSQVSDIDKTMSFLRVNTQHVDYTHSYKRTPKDDYVIESGVIFIAPLPQEQIKSFYKATTGRTVSPRTMNRIQRLTKYLPLPNSSTIN